ncbi:MAG: tetratricopeptide repeat-containing protein, partial [Desulfovibrio sp.]|nr:tetratricopeptide repeat-containing protein [Desulfovibrio sp.]
MKQKIEWYKEVLELEPGSKVFFPLAKLLAADKQIGEAASVLRQGLLRHPDHVEARLLLVELLYRQGADEELSAQTDALAHLFSAYPGFWSAWSESISSDPQMQAA